MGFRWVWFRRVGLGVRAGPAHREAQRDHQSADSDGPAKYREAVEYLDFMTTDTTMLTGAIEAINYQPPPIQLTAADFSA